MIDADSDKRRPRLHTETGVIMKNLCAICLTEESFLLAFYTNSIEMVCE